MNEFECSHNESKYDGIVKYIDTVPVSLKHIRIKQTEACNT